MYFHYNNIAYIPTQDIANLNKLDFTLGHDQVSVNIPKKIQSEVKKRLWTMKINGVPYVRSSYDFLACRVGPKHPPKQVYGIAAESFFWVVGRYMFANRHSQKDDPPSIPVKVIDAKKNADDFPKINPDDLFEKCTTKPALGKIIRGTDVITYSQSPFAFYCEHFVDDSKRDPHREDIVQLARKGVLHEDEIMHNAKQSILKELGVEHEDEVAEEYTGLVPVNFKQIQIPTMKEKFKICLDEMISKRAKSLHDAPLISFPANMCGRPDILERRRGESCFGKHYYVVKEVKSAKIITRHHILQAAFYNMLIGHIQKRYPEKFYVINGDKQEQEYEFEPWVLELECMLKSIMGVLQRRTMPEPVYNNTPYPWSEYGNKTAIKQNGVTLIAGIGERKREVLNQRGYRTVSQIAMCEESKLAAVPGIKSTASSIKAHAMALKHGKAIKKEKPVFPKKKTEVFLDFEGERDGSRIYLAGMIVRESNNERYVSLVSASHEKEIWAGLIDFLKKQNDYVIYHWSSYEPVHIKKMGKRHRTPAKLLGSILSENNLIDVYKIALSSFAFPTYHNSLKEVAKYVGFRWSQPNINGGNVGSLFDEYRRNPRKNMQSLQTVLDYNKDDCKATMVVRDWLAKNC